MLKKVMQGIKAMLEMTKRFPLSFLYILGFSGIFLYMTRTDARGVTKIPVLFKLSITLINMFFLSVSTYLFAEVKKYNTIKSYFLQGCVGIFGVLFYYYFSNNFGPHITTISIGILAILFVAPFLTILFKKQTKDTTIERIKENYTAYFSTLVGIVIGTIIFGFIIFILGIIIKETLYYLFDLRNIFGRFNDFYQYWSIICFSFLSPIFALSKIPYNTTNLKYSKQIFFGFLLKYIFVPVIFVYFIILYAYSIKVLINFGNWPKGQITWIVIAFASFGYFFYILARTYEKENTSIKVFRKYFPIAVIPQLAMLFYAIYLRINQHDITINRYLVVIFGIRLLGISLYFIFSKKKYSFVIPLSIGCISLFISVGPRGFYSVSETRQLIRLEKNLVKANILHEDGSITPLKKNTDIDEKLSRDISSGIGYLCDFNNCTSIKKLFAQELIEQKNEREKEQKERIKERKQALEKVKIKKKETQRIEKRIRELEIELEEGPRNRDIENYLKKYLKAEYYRNNHEKKEERKIFEYRTDPFPLDTKGYETVYNIHEVMYYENIIGFTQLQYTENNKIQTITIPKSLKEHVKKLKDEGYSKEYSTRSLNKKIVFDFIQGNKKYRLLISNIEFPLEQEGFYEINGFLLVK